jgi:hypothetical protein
VPKSRSPSQCATGMGSPSTPDSPNPGWFGQSQHGYGRPAGHAGRAPNRGDVAVSAWTGVEARRLHPGWRCKGAFDVSGGWYDAGDYGKYVTSGSIAGWQLLSTLGLLKADSSPRVRQLADLVRRYSSLSANRRAVSTRRRASANAFTASRCRDWASARCR